MEKLYNPIAMYVYNKNRYFIACKDKKIICFKYENGEVSNDYNKDEYTLFLKVLNSIRVNKKSAINLGVRNENGKSFETFFDIEKNLYFWYEVLDGRRANPQKSDWQYLNIKYNSIPLVCPETEGGIDPETQARYEKEKAVKRTINHAGKTFAVLLTAGISLITVSDAVLHTQIGDKIRSTFTNEELQETTRASYDYDLNQPYDFKLIEDAINGNNSLSDKEKECILKFKEFFDMNHEFMDIETVVNNLRTLQIEYTTEPCEEPGVMGAYTRDKNSIKIYETNSFDDCDLNVFTHEMCHAFQATGWSSLLPELSNEAFCREALRNATEDGLFDEKEFNNEYDVPQYGHGYSKAMRAYYLVENLMDEGSVKEYQFRCHNGVVIEQLARLEGVINPEDDFEKAEEVKARGLEIIETIDSFKEKDDDGHDIINVTYEKMHKLCDELDYYYLIKFGKTIEECFTENIMYFDENFYNLDEKDPVILSIDSVVYDNIGEKYDNLDPNGNKNLLGDMRYVLPKSLYSKRHANPILYMNIMLETSKNSGEGLFTPVEITPELEKKFESKVEEYDVIINGQRDEKKKLAKENSEEAIEQSMPDYERD